MLQPDDRTSGRGHLRESAMRTILALFALTITLPASAIVIRHDVADSAYRADAADYPFLFLMYRTPEGYGDCVATMISPEWAVTAAHCTDVKSLTEGIASGGFEVEIGRVKNRIVQVERHPGTVAGRPVDLALLRLSKPATHVRPVKLYRSTDEVGREVMFPGWGDPGNGRDGVGKGDGNFRVAENRVDRTEAGRIIFIFDSPDSGKALPFEGISGPGDSGGPALVMTPQGWATMGVSSAQRVTGGKEGLYGVEEIYVRVSDYVSWIEANMARG